MPLRWGGVPQGEGGGGGSAVLRSGSSGSSGACRQVAGRMGALGGKACVTGVPLCEDQLEISDKNDLEWRFYRKRLRPKGHGRGMLKLEQISHSAKALRQSWLFLKTKQMER